MLLGQCWAHFDLVGRDSGALTHATLQCLVPRTEIPTHTALARISPCLQKQSMYLNISLLS